MDYDTRKSTLDQLKAHARLARALDHLSSEDFLALSEDERRAHAAAYRAELSKLETEDPVNIIFRSKVHLLSTYLQLYE